MRTEELLNELGIENIEDMPMKEYVKMVEQEASAPLGLMKCVETILLITKRNKLSTQMEEMLLSASIDIRTVMDMYIEEHEMPSRIMKNALKEFVSEHLKKVEVSE